MTGPAAFRFEYVCEAIAPDGSRTRIGSFSIPSACLTCGRSPVLVDSSGNAEVDGGTMLATVNNQTGMLCRVCVARERAR